MIELACDQYEDLQVEYTGTDKAVHGQWQEDRRQYNANKEVVLPLTANPPSGWAILK